MEVSATPPSPWVQEHEPSWWVLALRSLGGEAQIPQSDAGLHEWGEFLAFTLAAPLGLLTVGIVTALCMSPLLWCLRSKSNQRTSIRPSVCPALVALLLTAVTLGCGGALALAEGIRTFDNVEFELERGGEELSLAAVRLKALNATCADALQEMNTSSSPCSGSFKDTLDRFMTHAEMKVGWYLGDLADYSTVIDVAPEKVSRAAAWVTSAGRFAAAALAGPLALVALVALGAGSDVAAARLAKGRHLKACLGCSISFAPLVMFLVLMVTAAELSLGIVASNVCADVDSNIIRQARSAFGDDSATFNFTRYYIQGIGPNPAVRKVEEMQVAVASAFALLDKATPIILRSCTDWNGTELYAKLRDLDGGFEEYKQLLDPSNIYPYYKQAVHTDLCGGAIQALGAAMLCQALLCLVCLPLLQATTGQYLARAARGGDGSGRDIVGLPIPGPTLLTSIRSGLGPVGKRADGDPQNDDLAWEDASAGRKAGWCMESAPVPPQLCLKLRKEGCGAGQELESRWVSVSPAPDDEVPRERPLAAMHEVFCMGSPVNIRPVTAERSLPSGGPVSPSTNSFGIPIQLERSISAGVLVTSVHSFSSGEPSRHADDEEQAEEEITETSPLAVGVPRTTQTAAGMESPPCSPMESPTFSPQSVDELLPVRPLAALLPRPSLGGLCGAAAPPQESAPSAFFVAAGPGHSLAAPSAFFVAAGPGQSPSASPGFSPEAAQHAVFPPEHASQHPARPSLGLPAPRSADEAGSGDRFGLALAETGPPSPGAVSMLGI